MLWDRATGAMSRLSRRILMIEDVLKYVLFLVIVWIIISIIVGDRYHGR